MFRGILNVPFLGVAILWLLLLANPIEGRQGVIQARAGPNYLSHARERMWLYDVYDIMCEIEGPDKQNMILPFDKRQGDRSSYNNKGLTNSNGKLTYAEFQARVGRLPLIKEQIPDLIQPGVNGKTIESAAQDILDAGWGKELPAKEVDPSQKSKNYKEGGKNYEKSDPFKSDYHDLMEKAEAKISEYRVGGKFNSVLESRLPRMTQLTKEINILRREDSLDHLTENLGKDVNNYGLGFDPVHSTEKDSGVPGGNKWKEPDLQKTFDDNWASEAGRARLEGWGFKTKQDFIKWVDNMGDPFYRQEGTRWPSIYNNIENSHFRTAKTWANIDQKLNMGVDDLKSCGIK